MNSSGVAKPVSHSGPSYLGQAGGSRAGEASGSVLLNGAQVMHALSPCCSASVPPCSVAPHESTLGTR